MLHKNLAELLYHSIDNLYGYLPAEVFHALASHGRLTSIDIQRKIGLRPKDVNSALVILVQQHLVRHHTIANFSRSVGSHYDSTTFYEADWESAYKQTIRAGKILRLVEERYGEAAGGLMLNLLRFGHATVADLISAYNLVEQAETDDWVDSLFVNGGQRDGTTNGHTKSSARSAFSSVGQLHATLDMLLSAGFIKPVHEILDFWPAQDRQAHIKSTIRAVDLRDAKSVKSKQEEYDLEVRQLQVQWQGESDQFFNKTAVKSVINQVVDPHADRNGHDSGARLDDKLTLRINFEKCDVLIRHGYLTRMAERYVGSTTSKVYAAFLQALDARMLRCIDPLEDPSVEENDDEGLTIPVSTHQVTSNLPDNVDLRVGLVDQALINGYTNGVNGHHSDDEDISMNGRRGESARGGATRGESPDEEIEEQSQWRHGMFGKNKRPAEDSTDEDNLAVNGTHKRAKMSDSGAKRESQPENRNRVFLVESHLRLLADDPHGFVRRVGTEWRVSMVKLTHDLQQAEIENTITARFGYLAASIVRILRAKGNLEEKQIASSAMVDPKDVRIAVGRLLQAGLIEEIEVPRDTNRSTSKAAYLCSYNPLRARRQILAITYKTMTRLLQRSEHEKDRIKNLVELSERSDIRKNRGLLNKGQSLALTKWEDTEERILVQVSRCDEVVALLRDFVREEYIPKVEPEADIKMDNRAEDTDEEIVDEEEVVEEDEGGGEFD